MRTNCAMLSGMGTEKKKLWERLPFKAAGAGVAKEAGLWSSLWGWILGAAGLVMSAAVAAWAWLESQLPYWAIFIVFLVVLIGSLHASNVGYSIVLKRRQDRLMTRLVHIDRDALANDLEAMSQKIANLAGEYAGPLQEAWWKGAETGASIQDMRLAQARIEGKIIERFSLKYATETYVLLRRAAKVMNIDMGMAWHLQIHGGIRSHHDVMTLYPLLARLADDIRYPAPALPTLDELQRGHLIGARPPSPQGAGGG